LTPRTIAALSGGEPASLEAELVANMEIWRWVPRDMGHDRIEVNLTEFAARLYRDDKSVYTTKVVVGKPTTPTPVFSNRMQFLIVNPYWNVPLSIVKKEMMPKLAEDPDYFAKHGYQLVQHGHLTYVRQPPGDANALGRIKFMFPNEHSVYMHDTPSKSFFARDVRAFSHGCVRVDQPFRFAEAVLGQGWTEEKVRKLQQGRSVRQRNALQVRMELQADCYAGIWAHDAQRSRHVLEEGDLEEALAAAQAVGDDMIQRQTQGTVMPETFTHGTAKQRQRWFKAGFASGQLKACDTFRAATL
jgi:murein L,D-transpeptidase YcbB/YkuD